MSDEVYVNGSRTRIVSTPAQRVDATWNGFAPAGDVAEGADRKTLQETAKSLGIKANQSSADLQKAIADFKPTDESVDPADESETLGQAPETDNGGSPLES